MLPRLFVVGDSISMQYGPYLERFCAGSFSYARKTGDEGFADLDNPTGANGGDSAMVRDYLEHYVRAGGPPADYLLVNCGLHDLKTHPETGAKQIPIGAYEENLVRIVALCGSRDGSPGNPRLLWTRTTPVVDEIHNSRQKEFRRYSADVARYNATADAVMHGYQVPTIDLHSFTERLGPPEKLFIDHVHFSETVRQAQAAYIAGYVAALR
jgi:lysophospholipase L1-like esterase